MKTIVITGISGILGSALGRLYIRKGWHVIGVSRKDAVEDSTCFSELHTNAQDTEEDARKLLDFKPDIIVLNAGQIETEVGKDGLPLLDQYNSITKVNYLFPSWVSIQAAEMEHSRPLDIIAIGSIADGSPSCFGPIYHASKIALHYFVSGVGPIAYYAAEKNVRIRLYRPGAIKGPLAWAPVNRVNEAGYKIRAKRVNSAPNGDHVARVIVKWIESGNPVGTYDEPFSFKIFKYLFALAPNFFYRLQMLGWLKGSKFV